ncbi:MAG: shikimate kinase AroK [Acidiferrobacteraceae bacterium]
MSGTKNVFLIGPMGAGKSTIGRHLAGLLGLRFLDSDREIERRTGATIPWIFEIEGEEGFRRRECEVIRELTSAEGVVLATGGGVVLNEQNRACLGGGGFVVYLEAGLETLLARTRRDRHRPLLQKDDPRTVLGTLLAARHPLYLALADLVISTENRSAVSVAREVAQHFKPENHENTVA